MQKTRALLPEVCFSLLTLRQSAGLAELLYPVQASDAAAQVLRDNAAYPAKSPGCQLRIKNQINCIRLTGKGPVRLQDCAQTRKCRPAILPANR